MSKNNTQYDMSPCCSRGSSIQMTWEWNDRSSQLIGFQCQLWSWLPTIIETRQPVCRQMSVLEWLRCLLEQLPDSIHMLESLATIYFTVPSVKLKNGYVDFELDIITQRFNKLFFFFISPCSPATERNNTCSHLHWQRFWRWSRSLSFLFFLNQLQYTADNIFSNWLQ